MILSKPQLAFLRDDIEDFALCVHQVGVTSLLPGFVDIELEERCSNKEDRRVLIGIEAGPVAG